MTGVTAMKMNKSFVTILGVVALGVSSSVVSAEAATRKCITEECACEEALRQNTIEALETFLKEYPYGVDSGKSACAALGIPSLDDNQGVSLQGVEQGIEIEPFSEDLSSGG